MVNTTELARRRARQVAQLTSGTTRGATRGKPLRTCAPRPGGHVAVRAAHARNAPADNYHSTEPAQTALIRAAHARNAPADNYHSTEPAQTALIPVLGKPKTLPSNYSFKGLTQNTITV